MTNPLDISLHFDFKDTKDNKKIFSREKLDRNFKIMQENKICFFNTWCNDAVFPEFDEIDIEVANAIAIRIKETGIKMNSFHFVGSVLDCYDDSQIKVREFMDRSLRIFSVCNPKCFVLHPGTFTEGGFEFNKKAFKFAIDTWGEEKTYSLLVENLRYFGIKAKEYNIKLAIENIFQGRFYSKIDELIKLVNDINLENVGFCLDVGHANVDNVDIPNTIKDMGNKLFEIHLHDNDGLKDQHLPIGFGNLNWLSIIKSLHAIHYKGCATFEFFRWPYLTYEEGVKCSINMWIILEKIAEDGYRTVEWN